MDENKQTQENQNEDTQRSLLEKDDNLKEIMKKAKNQKTVTDEERKKLIEQADISQNFLKLIDTIELPKDKYVIFTDDVEQLVYENGEFFIVSTTDSTKTKKKKKRSEATDMYVEYFIKYQLDPIIKQNKLKEKVKEMVQNEPEKIKSSPVKAEKKIEKNSIDKSEKIKVPEKKQEEEELIR